MPRVALNFGIEPHQDEWSGARDAFTKRVHSVGLLLLVAVAISAVAVTVFFLSR
jgi:hypothetical protein